MWVVDQDSIRLDADPHDVGVSVNESVVTTRRLDATGYEV